MKEKTNWKIWFRAAGVRALKTMAQTAAATIGATAVLAGILSLLTSLGGLPELEE